VVTGAGRDDQQRHLVLGGDAGDQGLGAVPAGHPQQIGPLGHRPAGQLAHVHHLGPFQQGHGGPEASALSLRPNLATFPPPERGFMIRNGRRGGATSYSRSRSGMASRRNAARPATTARATASHWIRPR
jgi:hypothetical protein